MIPVRIRHKTSRRGLGFTAFSLKDKVSGQAVANWIVATLQCQGISPPDAELKIGGEPWKSVVRKEKSSDVKAD